VGSVKSFFTNLTNHIVYNYNKQSNYINNSSLLQVYDITVEGAHEFVANGFLVHNSDRCLSLDGRVVRPGSQEEQMYSPPQHTNCRSIWVEIMEGEIFPPDITGIPSSIDPVYDWRNSSELKVPVIEKGSFAIKVLQNEIAERQAKIDEYKQSGMYQNRIDTHQSRINDLNKSLKKAMKETLKDLVKVI
jgi:hypothetical protein